MQGLGLFSCRKAAWPGFHPGFRGFGGEEGYIHEKFRKLGRRCLCLPWLRWVHRFARPAGAPYPLRLRDRITNYLIGHREVGLDEAPVLDHFRASATATEAEIAQAVRDADAVLPTVGRTGSQAIARRSSVVYARRSAAAAHPGSTCSKSRSSRSCGRPTFIASS